MKSDIWGPITGIGGLVLSPLTQLLIDRLGFRWALRVTGLVTFGGTYT